MEAAQEPPEIELATLHVVTWVFIVAFYGIANHLPVHQVGGGEDGASRHVVHAGRDHVEAVVHANDIGVGPVSP